ncbi:hypothetical protein, partial [Klebsiella pneumoniae]|uniref:hypothetical protein n=1 Tax=Klebsiella pneumoniae TaxID=573 RepID=UPI0039C45995
SGKSWQIQGLNGTPGRHALSLCKRNKAGAMFGLGLIVLVCRFVAAVQRKTGVQARLWVNFFAWAAAVWCNRP